MLNENAPKLNYEELPVPKQSVIDGVPGMEPAKVDEPDTAPIVLDNPSAQTLRTAIGTPYAEVAPGVLKDVSGEAPNEKLNDKEEDSSAFGAAAIEGLLETNTESDDTRPDVDKAWDMAHASTIHRGLAAGRRGAARKIDEEITQLPETAAALKIPVEQRERAKDDEREARKVWQNAPDEDTQEFKDARDQLMDAEGRKYAYGDEIDDIIDSKDPVIREALEVLASRLRRGDDVPEAVDRAERNARSIQKLFEVSAEESDEKAERLETWVGILHDQPLSDAYKQRFGLADEVTPALLVELEDAVEQNSDDAEHSLDSKLKKTFLEDIRTGRAHQWQ